MKIEIKFPDNLSEEDKKALKKAFDDMALSGCIRPNTPKEHIKRIISKILG